MPLTKHTTNFLLFLLAGARGRLQKVTGSFYHQALEWPLFRDRFIAAVGRAALPAIRREREEGSGGRDATTS